MRSFFVAALVFAFFSSGFAASPKNVSSEVKEAVRKILANGSKLNTAEFGVQPEVRVVSKYKIIEVRSHSGNTLVKIDLTISATKKFDEVTHRYVEKRNAKPFNESTELVFKTVAGRLELARAPPPYELDPR
ncbi:hypothetical protein BH10BDE1_BH10BDE1_08730 [soil metagenome]